MNADSVEILLVEDNASHAEMTIRALRKQHISDRIRVMRDGAEAVAFLFDGGLDAQPTPRVVMLDLKLPKVDGIEVLRRIKSNPRTQNISVVVLTSSHNDHDLRACYVLGVNSYVVKPVDFQQFSEAVGTLGRYWLLLNRCPD
ncbi:MAG TPA: response regulator [bacterium]|nr:response regulator [bacterium]